MAFQINHRSIIVVFSRIKYERDAQNHQLKTSYSVDVCLMRSWIAITKLIKLKTFTNLDIDYQSKNIFYT